MSSGYDIYQQVFCLSLVIDTAYDQKGSASFLEGILQGNINTLLGNSQFNDGDNWSIAWGPVVWQAPGSQVVDNAMAVCYNAKQNFYVVPISATNVYSAYDIFFEDLAAPANFMLPFPGGGAGNVSAGNSAALEVLLTMESGGSTLSAFLGGLTNPNDSVAFCGHSLGGGLTPLLAYALFPKGTSNSGWANVYTYPTAGPATADQGFASLYSAAFPVTGSGYQMWNANQYNSYDIVPNAWSGQMTSPGIAQIYAGTSQTTTAMFYTDWTMLGEVAVLQTLATAIAQGTTGANPYVSVNCNQLFSGPRDNGQITSNTMLESEILYQHTVAYSQAFGVSDLFPDDLVKQMIKPSLQVLVRGVAGAGAARSPA